MSHQMNQNDFIALIQENRGIIHKVTHLYCTQEEDKEDLFQEIVIQLWKSYGKFRGDAKFSTWMYRIAINTAITSIRKTSRTIRTVSTEVIPVEIQLEQYDKEKEAQLYQLYTAIKELNEIERSIVMLYLDDRSYDEMEEILGINQNNLRVKMNRIKDKLRKITNNN
ncbi:RNA polymerase sigma factor [Gynurincola endophyticus]|uniref:RNA polymerase sigma factor n=1 Tax=Gynurincola endophyticus TaxID=2479004 RepID=UPI0018F2B1E2|nr:sigma-70 family RNA polymerase sigma factor [Gynurincola endophyticus]